MGSAIGHSEDGGEITLFFSEEQVLFACNKGHWWIVDVAQFGQNEPALPAIDDDALERSLSSLEDRFGEEPLRLMNFR